MDTRIVDIMARGAAVSRRGSRRVLGGAALAGALAAPTAAGAGKAGRKGQKRCQQQRSACIVAIKERCAPNIDPAVCEAALNPCCGHFARCNAGTGLLCLFNIT